MVIIGEYSVSSVVGRGRFGWVSRAHHRILGHAVAVKHQPWPVGGAECSGSSGDHADCQHVDEDKWRAALEHEAHFLAKISHPSIVALVDILRLPTGGLCVCLEDLGDTTLESLVYRHYYKNETGLAEPFVACVFHQITQGLNHLHECGILHRDIKPENVMVFLHKDEDNGLYKPIAKLIDFGLAAAWTPNNPLCTAVTRVGTVTYMAPELTGSAHKYGPEVDVFSLGVALYYSLIGETPFVEYQRNGCRGTTALFGLMAQHLDALDTISDSASKLVQAILKADPKQRWTLEQFCSSKWLAVHYPESTLCTPVNQAFCEMIFSTPMPDDACSHGSESFSYQSSGSECKSNSSFSGSYSNVMNLFSSQLSFSDKTDILEMKARQTSNHFANFLKEHENIHSVNSREKKGYNGRFSEILEWNRKDLIGFRQLLRKHSGSIDGL